jgi:hypothetical protein
MTTGSRRAWCRWAEFERLGETTRSTASWLSRSQKGGRSCCLVLKAMRSKLDGKQASWPLNLCTQPDDSPLRSRHCHQSACHRQGRSWATNPYLETLYEVINWKVAEEVKLTELGIFDTIRRGMARKYNEGLFSLGLSRSDSNSLKSAMKIAWLLGRKSLKSDYCSMDGKASVDGSAITEALAPARSDFPPVCFINWGPRTLVWVSFLIFLIFFRTSPHVTQFLRPGIN